jgi:hypothetical protein
MDLLSAIDNKCPAWLELFTSRGNYTVAFVVNIGGSTMLRSKDDCNDFLAGCTAASLVDNTFSPRLSHTERLRRMVGFVLTVPDKDGLVDSGRLFIFKQRRRNFSNEFRRSGEPLLSDKERAHAKLSGFLFRAVSDRHWIEEWVKLTDRCIYFYHPEKRKRSFCVHLSNIIELGRLQQDECPSLSGQFFLVIKTLGRSIYLMFGSEKDCEMFFSATLNQKIQVEGGTDRMNSVDSDSSFSSLSLSLVDNPADEFLHRSTMWNCQKRRILNGGKFLFRHPAVPPDPLRLVEDALKQALDSVNNGDEVEQRRIFLDSTAMLKQADVRALSDTSKLVFFLNLYHLMIMHAYLVIGPPGWSLQWISYFNNIAYQVSDDILSFAELEHCILRNNMSHPSQFMSRFVIPRSHYSMAIATIDFRINFALNCGSLSNPSSVVVFKESSLDSQLDAVSREYLKSVSVTRKSGRKINIDIPRICEWFLGDFGGSEDELLKNVGPYLSDWQRKELSTCWLSESQCYDTTFITIRYQPFNFECRPLTLANF